MKQVLVTGATGFVGKQLCSVLATSGYGVRGAVREGGQKSPGIERATEIVPVGDLGEDPDWGTAVSGIDTVVHLAARVHVMHESCSNPLEEFRRINCAGTERLAREAAKAGVRRFVYLSTIKVNGEETIDQPFRETDPPGPEDAYAVSKWEAERVLKRLSEETGLEVVIVRPPLVYGPGVKGNFLKLLRLVRAGLPLPLASVANRRSLVSLDNLVDLIVVCLRHPSAAGEVFLAADGEDLSTPDLIRRISRSMGKPNRLFPFPPSVLKGASRVLGKRAICDRLCGSLTVDSTKAKKVLGWQPPSSVDQSLDEMTRWFMASPLLPS